MTSSGASIPSSWRDENRFQSLNLIGLIDLLKRRLKRNDRNLG